MLAPEVVRKSRATVNKALFRFSSDPARYVQRLDAGRDPYQVYDRIRARGAVLSSGVLPLFVTADYATAESVIRDGRFKKQGAARQSAAVRNSPLAGSMLFVDPPQHTRLRRLAVQAFTPTALEGLRTSIERMANELLDGLGGRASMDFMREYAGPLPRMVIGEILGLPEEQIRPLATAGATVGAALDGALSRVTEGDIQK